jgi:hypothetical protein
VGRLEVYRGNGRPFLRMRRDYETLVVLSSDTIASESYASPFLRRKRTRQHKERRAMTPILTGLGIILALLQIIEVCQKMKSNLR